MKLISNPADEYFGYNVFNQDPEFFQKSMEPSADSDYQVGPGDEIIILLSSR